MFNNEKCEVFYDNDIILRGYKDPATDLWTLLITHNKIAKTTQESLSEWYGASLGGSKTLKRNISRVFSMSDLLNI